MASAPLGVSVVVSVWNDEAWLYQFQSKLTTVLKSLAVSYEIVYVDRGSTDHSGSIVREFASKDAACGAVILARDFGEQEAIAAGLEVARGACVITMCPDMHPPDAITRLIAAWKNGALVVHGVADQQSLEDQFADVFFRAFNRLSDVPVKAAARDFVLYDRRVVDLLRAMPERHRFTRGMATWLGLIETTVPFAATPRPSSLKKLSTERRFAQGLNLLFSFSAKPLRAAFWLGCASILLAFAAGYVILYRIFVGDHGPSPAAGTAILLLIVGGLQLLFLSLIGEYIARIFEQTKGRPLFVVREVIPVRI